MDRVKTRLDMPQLEELLGFVQWYVGQHQPGKLRMQYMGKPAHEKAVALVMVMLNSRLLVRLSTLSIRMRSEHVLNIPAEEGIALLYAWTTTPTSSMPKKWLLTRHIVGTIDQKMS